MLLVTGTVAIGQNIIRPKIACPNDIWVNAYNGVLFYQRVDINIPTAGENPLAAVFDYNSSFASYNFGYGNGWSLAYEWRCNTYGDTIVIMQGDGRTDAYLPDGDGFKAPEGVFNKLNLSNGNLTLTTPEGVSYVFLPVLQNDGMTVALNDSRASYVTDRNGNVIHIVYTEGRITRMTDMMNRAIRFEYNSEGYLSRLWVDGTARQWTYDYDAHGNIISVTSPLQNTVYYGYDKENRINRFTDAAGHSTNITYSPDGEVNRVKTELSDMSIRYELSSSKTVVVDYLDDGNNQFTTYVWDTLGRVVEKSGNCCGYTSKLVYDDNDNITSSKDALGNETTYTYDERGNMLSMTDPLGYTENYSWHHQYNLPTSYTDRAGHQYSYTYDNHGNLTKITGPENYQVQYTYNDHGQPTKRTDALGNETIYAYDTYGNLTSHTDALGHTETFTYDLMGNLLSYTNPVGNATTYSYNAEEKLVSTTDPTGARTTFAYTPKGYVQTIIKPGNSSFTYSQNAHGQLVAFTDPLGATMYFTYNAKDKITAMRDALGNVTQYEYDDRDRMTSVTDPLGNSIHYTYDAMGRPTAAAYSNGLTKEYQYDAIGQLIQVSDNLGTLYKVTYNALGQKTRVLTAKTRTGDNYTYDTTSRTYDNRGRLHTVKRPGNQTVTYTYDAMNHLTALTDAGGNTQTYVYDAAGYLVSYTDPLQGTTQMTYDDAGRQLSVTDPKGNITSYTYDAAGRITQVTFPNNKTEQYTYDQRGNIVRFKDKAGNEIHYTYNAANRLISIIYPDGNSDQYTYDALGRMLSVSGGGSSVTMSYDALGRTLTEAVTNPFSTYATPPTTAYAYDDEDGSVTITYPNGRKVKTDFDLRNRPSTVSSTVSPTIPTFQTNATYTIRADNRTAQLTYGNSVNTTYRYGKDRRPSAIVAGVDENNPLQYLHMGYDPVGNILAQIDSVSLARSEFYQYDALSRLTELNVGTPSTLTQTNNQSLIQKYNYDAVGNRTSTKTIMQTGIQTVNYASNSINGYTQVGNRAMQYDGNGNLVNDGIHTYQYDYANRLVSVDNGATATYIYDPLGRRIRKTNGRNWTTDYFYAGRQMIESTSTTKSNNNTITQSTTDYVYSPLTDDVLMVWRGDDKYYFHKNRLGSTVAVTNASGAVVERYSYDVFGAPKFFAPNGAERASSVIGNDILFVGREYDRETGLYYFRARYVSPSTGQFLQQDPLLYVDGYNLYAYVGNNPTNYVDPTGLSKDGRGDCGGTGPNNPDNVDPGNPMADLGASAGACAFATIGGCLSAKLGAKMGFVTEIQHNYDNGIGVTGDFYFEIQPYALFDYGTGVGVFASANANLEAALGNGQFDEMGWSKETYNQASVAAGPLGETAQWKNADDVSLGGSAGPMSLSHDSNGTTSASIGTGKSLDLGAQYSEHTVHKVTGPSIRIPVPAIVRLLL